MKYDPSGIATAMGIVSYGPTCNASYDDWYPPSVFAHVPSAAKWIVWKMKDGSDSTDSLCTLMKRESIIMKGRFD